MLGAVALSGVAILYGHPFIFHDSGTYLLYGEHVYDEVRSIVTGSPSYSVLGEVTQDYVGARSPTYSVLLFLVKDKSSLWGIVAIQSLASSWLLYLVAKCFSSRSTATLYYWSATALLAVGSALPYYAAFAMPDVFSGLGALALILLLTAWDRLSIWERAVVWTLLAAAASFHITNVVTFAAAATAGAVTAVGLRFESRRILQSSMWVSAALLIGASSGPVYRGIEREVFRHPISAPPFLTARVLADGPGVKLIEARCSDGRPFAVCDYSPVRPVEADVFLWSPKDEGGFFEYNDAATRSELISEQYRFIKEAVSAHPIEQALASAKNAASQLWMVDVEEPVAAPQTQSSYPLFEEVHDVSRKPLPETALDFIRRAVVLASVVGLVAFFLWARTRTSACPVARRITVVLVIVAAVILVNAFLAGVISGPHARYQARVVWILPAIFILAGAMPTSKIRRAFLTRMGQAPSAPA